MSSITLVKKKPGIYENMVMYALGRMTKGYLRLTLPNGETTAIGEPNASLSADLSIKDEQFFKCIVLYGDIGFGESYVEGLWETKDITSVIKWIIANIENAPSVSGSKIRNVGLNLFKWFNQLYHRNRANSLIGSQKNIAEHYDLNNDFFAIFLDPSLTYSSAYFKTPNLTLEQAQEAKYRRLCEQLQLKATDHVLEIGSGWGANALFMAKNYGCKVTSVTISKEQQRLAQQRVTAAGLTHKIDIVIQDYRNITGEFDKIVSVEMLEAVGHNYYETYFAKCNEVLKPNGILAFQVITSPDSRYQELRKGVDWIQKHIFPGSLLPSVAQLNKAINHTSELTLVDLKDLGLDYAKTLRLWFEAFNHKLNEVRALGFDDRFIRKWNYYLNYCEAAFAMRNINVMQMVYVRPNNTER
ncbi:MAG: cyclopropane-fatty-acyl-phospholipid synthase family protein [Pedobacter sp.]|nr:cyclopropane-fatty-acyl-phospholipid synthase family protein [Pedobacter sp.]MDQ8053864.1 cyclopropane-fatty-acyl-phospholipid synthase family protein [Pedobacter sp.]